MKAIEQNQLPSRIKSKKKVKTRPEVDHKIAVSKSNRLLNLSFKSLLQFPREILEVTNLR